MFFVRIWEYDTNLKEEANRFSVIGKAVRQSIMDKDDWREAMNLKEIVVNSANRHVIEIYNLIEKGYSVVYVGKSTKTEIIQVGLQLMGVETSKIPFLAIDMPHLYVIDEDNITDATSIIEKVGELKILTGTCVVVTEGVLKVDIDPSIPLINILDKEILYYNMSFSFLLDTILYFSALNLNFIKELQNFYNLDLKVITFDDSETKPPKHMASFAYLDEENKLQLKVKTDILHLIGNYDSDTN
ncbi:hypothetical protein D3C81_07310 [compost metagenome]